MIGVTILTGERGIGKTTICQRAIKLARADGVDCGGILTLARDGVREAYDVRNDTVRRLTQESETEPTVVQGRFCFKLKTLSWGNEVLLRSVPCGLLVIDEVGPLEIRQDAGWVAAFEVLRSREFALAVVVVRPELVTRAQDRLPDLDTEVLCTTRGNRDELPGLLTEKLRSATHAS